MTGYRSPQRREPDQWPEQASEPEFQKAVSEIEDKWTALDDTLKEHILYQEN